MSCFRWRKSLTIAAVPVATDRRNYLQFKLSLKSVRVARQAVVSRKHFFFLPQLWARQLSRKVPADKRFLSDEVSVFREERTAHYLLLCQTFLVYKVVVIQTIGLCVFTSCTMTTLLRRFVASFFFVAEWNWSWRWSKWGGDKIRRLYRKI